MRPLAHLCAQPSGKMNCCEQAQKTSVCHSSLYFVSPFFGSDRMSVVSLPVASYETRVCGGLVVVYTSI